ncbi:MAG: hypothetical protein WBD40_11190 [Tepidisphaeraceae bacterium]
MTATPRTASYEPFDHRRPWRADAVTARAALVPDVVGDDARRRDRRVFGWTMAIVLAIFALLQNPYWVPAGDSEVYITVARNMARGDGYRFNGQPVAMVPPGWPAAMALVMKVSPYFMPLKLLAMGCMLGSLAIGFWICRRFLSPGWASVAIVSTALLTHVYQATFWLISEGLFCLFSSASLLIAMQISEGRDEDKVGWRSWWRVGLLALMCALAVTVRWAGVLGVLLVVGALLERRWRPELSRPWIAALVAVTVTLGTFKLIRDVQSAATAAGTGTLPVDLAGGGAGEEAGTAPPALADKFVSKQYELVTGTVAGATYTGRFIGWGRWISWLYWQPFRAGASHLQIDFAAHVVGWVVIGLLLVTVGWGVAQRQWVWLMLLAYCGALAINWPNPNARYLVPIAFLLTAGVIRAAEALRSIGPKFHRVAITAGLWTFVVGTLLCNAVLWSIDVRVAHAKDFYGRYEAGINQTIIAACKHLSTRDLADGQIAVTPAYTNMGRRRPSPFALRATTMLTGKAIIQMPKKWQIPPSTRLARWLNRNGVEYYLHQNPISPWRVWHFRVPDWWQQSMTGVPVEELEAGWKLYLVVPGDAELPALPGVVMSPIAEAVKVPPSLLPVDVPRSKDWPTRVPGL